MAIRNLPKFRLRNLFLSRPLNGALEKSKIQIDLIVGVNTDESVRLLKGPERPVNPLADRLGVLEGLACVDHVVAFADETPARLIELVRPHIFAKGGDYAGRELPEAAAVAACGAEIRILPLLPDHSTTRVIHRAFRAGGATSRVSAAR